MSAGAGSASEVAGGATHVGVGRTLQRRHTPLCDLTGKHRAEAIDFYNVSFLIHGRHSFGRGFLAALWGVQPLVEPPMGHSGV